MTYLRRGPTKTGSVPFRPLLAATLEDVKQIRYWNELIYASPKLDGIRCIILNGCAYSRNMKPIRNKYVQARLKGVPDGLDGELIVGDPTDPRCFNNTTSGVMSEAGEPDFQFYVFDHCQMGSTPYVGRLNTIDNIVFEQSRLKDRPLKLVPQTKVFTAEDLLCYERDMLDQGYEGIMVRRGYTLYKQGRSTLNEGILWKLKRFYDGEGVVVELHEGVHNTNEATRSPLGYIKRSTEEAGLVPSGMVGTIVIEDLVTKERVNLSPGRLTHHERVSYWQSKELIGKIVKYKTFKYGAVNAPRFSTFQGLRHEDDL